MNRAADSPKKILIFYHYFYPDDVVSAQHYSHLAEDLRARGWTVVVLTSNRARHDSTIEYPRFENWNGVEIRRVWRPGFRQDSVIQRFLTASWMIGAWCLAAFRKASIPDVDVIVVGTDPVMSISCIPIWKLVRSRTKIVHWCFDLFPDIAVAAGLLGEDSIPFKMVRKLCRWIYTLCDLIVDTSSCQRKRLGAGDIPVRKATCTPWAIVEPKHPVPIDEAERKKLFGAARLALLYSGNLGRAHDYDMFVELARRLRNENTCVVFGVRGSRSEELERDIAATDEIIRLCDFVSMDRLQARLSAPDIHLLSLRPEWTGTLVPSKFFGALAIGRPVIFCGSPESGIAKWITKHRIGWLLTRDTIDSVVADMIRLAADPDSLEGIRKRCHGVYQEHFARKKVIDVWHRELRSLIDT